MRLLCCDTLLYYYTVLYYYTTVLYCTVVTGMRGVPVFPYSTSDVAAKATGSVATIAYFHALTLLPLLLLYCAL